MSWFWRLLILLGLAALGAWGWHMLAEDPGLESPRGKAARLLLWLLDQDRAIQLISVG